MTNPQPVEGPGYQYHLMRGAAERFRSSVAGLTDSQLAEVRAQASKTYALESLVLSSAEADEVFVRPEEVDAALARVHARYVDPSELLTDLRLNGLTQDLLRLALHRELLFDRIMEHVAADWPGVSGLDARRYYDHHVDRFVRPERRVAWQILVTINDELEDNRRDAAHARIERIAADLRRHPTRFAEHARRSSECPSALEGGKIGGVQRGQLYPPLDEALFRLPEGALSDVIETEIGFHLLWHQRLVNAKRVPFSVVEARIRRVLEAQRRRRRQRAFVARLQSTT